MHHLNLKARPAPQMRAACSTERLITTTVGYRLQRLSDRRPEHQAMLTNIDLRKFNLLDWSNALGDFWIALP